MSKLYGNADGDVYSDDPLAVDHINVTDAARNVEDAGLQLERNTSLAVPSFPNVLLSFIKDENTLEGYRDVGATDEAALKNALANVPADSFLVLPKRTIEATSWPLVTRTTPLKMYSDDPDRTILKGPATVGSDVFFMEAQAAVSVEGVGFERWKSGTNDSLAGGVFRINNSSNIDLFELRGVKATDVGYFVKGLNANNSIVTRIGLYDVEVETTAYFAIHIITSFDGLDAHNVKLRTVKRRAFLVGEDDYTRQVNNAWTNYDLKRVWIEDVTETLSSGGRAIATNGLQLYGTYCNIDGLYVDNVWNSFASTDALSTDQEGVYFKMLYLNLTNFLIKDGGGREGMLAIKGRLVGETDAPQGHTYSISNGKIINTRGALRGHLVGAFIGNERGTLENVDVYNMYGPAFATLEAPLNDVGMVNCNAYDTAYDRAFDINITGRNFRLINPTVEGVVPQTLSNVAQGIRLFGKVPDVLEVDSGTAQAGTSITITLRAGASATDDIYRRYQVRITGGTGSGQYRRIATYNATTKVATVDEVWDTNPDNTSTYVVEGPYPSAFLIENPHIKDLDSTDTTVETAAILIKPHKGINGLRVLGGMVQDANRGIYLSASGTVGGGLTNATLSEYIEILLPNSVDVAAGNIWGVSSGATPTTLVIRNATPRNLLGVVISGVNPSVGYKHGNIFRVTNAGAVTMTGLANMLNGEEVTLVFTDANTTLDHSASFRLEGATDYGAGGVGTGVPANTVMKFAMTDNVIYEVSRRNT